LPLAVTASDIRVVARGILAVIPDLFLGTAAIVRRIQIFLGWRKLFRHHRRRVIAAVGKAVAVIGIVIRIWPERIIEAVAPAVIRIAVPATTAAMTPVTAAAIAATAAIAAAAAPSGTASAATAAGTTTTAARSASGRASWASATTRGEGPWRGSAAELASPTGSETASRARSESGTRH
jgi:hypothetical protein